MVSSGIGHRQKTSLPEVLLDWLVKVLGVERLALGVASTAGWPQGFLEEMMLISAGFSVAMMDGAVSNSFTRSSSDF